MNIRFKKLFVLTVIACICFTGCKGNIPSSDNLDAKITKAIEEVENTKNLIETNAIDQLKNTSEASSSDISTENTNSAETTASIEGNCSLHFVDVGQGDCEIIESDGEIMLIDSGELEYADKVIGYINNLGYDTIDYIVVTHPHSDHMGSMYKVVDSFNIKNDIIMPDATNTTKTFEILLNSIAKKGLQIDVPSVGDIYTVGDTKVEVLAPNGSNYEDLNNYSIVLRATYGEHSALFTGDAEDISEDEILKNGKTIKSDVLKVGHHGSNSSTTNQFLNTVSPSMAVIEVGEGNTYGHPTEATLNRLENANIRIYRTDLDGDIIINLDYLSVLMTKSRTQQEEVVANNNLNNETTSATSTTESGAYILNTNSKKFHLPSCDSVGKMSDKNKEEYSGSREDLISSGYSPCNICNP